MSSDLSVRAAGDEEILRGGTTNAGLVTRRGETVRRPLRATSGSTRALLEHLDRVGFDGAPRYLGVDRQGREVLTYIRGDVAIAPLPAWAMTDDALVSVAQLLRRYHQAAAGFDSSGHVWPSPIPERFRGELVTHNDPNLDNMVFRDGRAVALIDFDLASPGCVSWELACAARLWVPLRARRDAPLWPARRTFDRLALFADAYEATGSQRDDLVEALTECHRWCYDVVQQAVARGHPAFAPQWRRGGRVRASRTQRWLQAHHSELRTALGRPRA